jgi:uncharacterized membrane protein YqjE
MTTQRAAETPSLRELGRRLAGDIVRLFDQHVALLRLELQHGAAELAKSLALIVGAVLGVTTGTLFGLLALGLWVGGLVGSAAAGMLIVGAGLVLSGGALGLLGSRRLQRFRLIPEVIQELRRDTAWIQHGM